MTIKYGSLKYRRPTSSSYRQAQPPKEPPEIGELSTAANDCLRKLKVRIRYRRLRLMYNPQWYIVVGTSARVNYQVVVELLNSDYIETAPGMRTTFRLTNKGRQTADWLNKEAR